MKNSYEEFFAYFRIADKRNAVKWAMKKIEEGEITIEELYEDILKTALYSIDECFENSEDCIWREHVKTAIVRTIVECCYPYVLKRAEKEMFLTKPKVLIVCPEKELHEVAPRMASDLFILNGFDSIFVGGNTPRPQIHSAIRIEKPAIMVISVTDYYNISEAEKLIEEIIKDISETKIYVAGRAFERNPDLIKTMSCGYLDCFRKISSLKSEVV